MIKDMHWTSLAPALAFAVVLPACNILDVNNPNNLTEDDLGQKAAANAVVNSAVAANARGISNVWLGYLMATDEIVWIGSRDAWGQLDLGYVSNPLNEFTDAAFPLLTQARWMADTATVLLDAHVDSVSVLTSSLLNDQARAYLHAGLIYTIIGEVQEDFVFGHKQNALEPVGSAEMKTVLDRAIEKLDKAFTIATGVKAVEQDYELITRVLAVRARAKHSRALWDKIKPTVNTAQPLVGSAGARADAEAVIARAPADWRFQMTYSAATVTNFMASEINSRGEQQFDTTSIVSVNKAAPKTILAVKLQDPIAAAPDARILKFLREWKGDQNIGVAGTSYAPLTLVSTKHMHLIVAEDDLAKGDIGGFTTHINAVRAVDVLPFYAGQIPPLDMLKHERRAALFVTGVRLLDMYRFGVKDPVWQPGSDAFTRPGTLLPITCIERNANVNIEDC